MTQKQSEIRIFTILFRSILCPCVSDRAFCIGYAGDSFRFCLEEGILYSKKRTNRSAERFMWQYHQIVVGIFGNFVFLDSIAIFSQIW